jgi:kynureninase
LLLYAQDCAALDQATSALADFDAWRSAFAPGPEGTLYFDANSIGPMPVDAPARMQQVLDAGWRQARRRGWSELDWLQQPASLGAAIAPMLGADAAEVRVCDTTSINQYLSLIHI